MLVARIVGVHGHRGVAEHRLRPSRREADELARALDRILERPEAALDGLVVNLVVGDRGLQMGVPVDQTFAAIDETVAKEVEEELADGAGADRIEREARPLPIARAAQLAK